MPKGQVTDEELASGLRSMGGLSSLTTVKRDSPFRDSRAAAKTVEVPVPNESPRINEAPPAGSREKPPSRPAALPAAVKANPVEKAPRAEKRKPSQRKADTYSERITLQISPEMRDEVDSLAREIQRSKATKEERITANSVMRVAIRHFLDVFRLRQGDRVNTEEELLALLKRNPSNKKELLPQG